MHVDCEIELSRIRYAFNNNDETLQLICPYHKDSQPSLVVYKSDGRFYCHGCKKAGDFTALLVQLEHKPRYVVEASLEAKYGGDTKIVENGVIEEYHVKLFGHAEFLGQLAARCVGLDAIRKYRLGEDSGRITIPIANSAGQWVNIRQYLPGATDAPKMINLKGRGKILRLYPFEQLRYQKIILCGGEIKAIAAAEALNKHDIGAITLTGGELDWSIALEDWFFDKKIWVCSDIDDTGKQSAEFRCEHLSSKANWVGNVELPLDPERYPHGDLNDYLRDNGPDALKALLDDCEEYSTKAKIKAEEEFRELTALPTELSILDASGAQYVNKRVKCKVLVNAIGERSYSVPKEIKVVCTRNEDNCQQCPAYTTPQIKLEIGSESSNLLAIVDSAKRILDDEIKEALKIPPCKVAKFDVLSYYKVTETWVQKPLDLTEQTSNQDTLPAVMVDSAVSLNETYELTGKTIPHPKTQATTIVASSAVALVDALSAFTVGDTGDLLTFRPNEWTVESIDEKLDLIYKYYSHNVTRIYERPRLHQLIDLTYHSVLSMWVDERAVKGWLEVLVIGDSSQGKSDVADQMMGYYGLGQSVECKNATTPGLLGGLEQIGGKWFARWGIIPKNDRRLVFLEELKGLHPTVFAKLTDMRSSGEAEIPKIHQSKAPARTRLVAFTNPPENNIMNNYAYGIKAIEELIRNPEDIRRFDAAIVLNKDDIDAKLINRREKMEEPFPQLSARRLVLWAWTRTIAQINISDETYQRAVEHSNKLCEVYTDTIPLLDRGSTRFKILRFACALACRTFSSDETGQNVIVLPCHVDWVVKFLTEEYSSPSNGYLSFSKDDRVRQEVVNIVSLRDDIMNTPRPRELAQRMIATHLLEIQDFQDFCAWNRDEAAIFLSLLVRNNALQREGRAYKKTPACIQLLREIIAGGGEDPPPHIKEDENEFK